MVVIDINSGMICDGGTIMLREKSVNKIVINPHTDDGDVDFCTVGQQGCLVIWKFDPSQNLVFEIEPEMNQDLKNTDFTCATYTPKLPAPHNSDLILLGTADGAMCAVNPEASPQNRAN